MLKAYKYQLDLNNVQKTYFNKSFGCCRYVYNRALELKIKLYEKEKININYYDLCKKLTQWKNEEEIKWLNESDYQALQRSLFNLDNAFKIFFKEKKGFPKFKSKYDRQSCYFRQSIYINFKQNKIKLPKIEWLRIFNGEREFEDGQIRSATVSKTPAGKYFVSLLIDNKQDLPLKPKVQLKNSIGIDVGLKVYASCSNGEVIENPRHLKKSLNKLKYIQKQLSRKQKGSNRRNKLKLKVAKQHEKVRNQRTDFLHKLSSKIIRENQTIIVEDLNVAGLSKRCKPKPDPDKPGHFLPNGQSKKKGLNRAIQDAAWGEFFRQLEYKSDWYGKNFIKVPRFYPSSKTCFNCKHIKKDLTLKDRVWGCDQCHTVNERDHNASKNIQLEGIKTYVRNYRDNLKKVRSGIDQRRRGDSPLGHL